MSAKKNGVWICDSCGETIDKSSDGWVEWLCKAGEETYSGFRIVHNVERCQYSEKLDVYDHHLDHFLGPKGLLLLLELVDRSSVSEIVEIIRRLHVPGWERKAAEKDPE